MILRLARRASFAGLLIIASCLSTPGKNSGVLRLPAGFQGARDEFSARGYLELVERRKLRPGAEIGGNLLTSQLAGREIWFKSAPNNRFHSYIFRDRANAPIDWYKVLRSDQRWQRFNIWGMMNDPDCCTPGQDCDSRGIRMNGHQVTLKDTFGFDYCPGDDVMLSYVGHPERDYTRVDPACTNATVRAADELKHEPVEKACQLAFGTSSGAVGLRKFPNPRFNAERWEKFGGYEGFQKRNFDPSMEPPIRIGMACATCHASFDPLRPPKDVNHPDWFNISGTVGNQYIRISQILGSGTKPDSLEWQVFIPMSRAGTTDTSAVPNDMVINPGTMNAIINLPVRPKFDDSVTRWRKVPSCNPQQASCQVVNYNVDVSGHSAEQKYWEYKTIHEPVYHIIKGGEDSVGADLAVQRVYVNIGLCAELCWVNHHTDVRALNPHDRGFLQSPFDIGQCRRDCPQWRANEDRVENIVDFLASGRPFDLKEALWMSGRIQGKTGGETNANFKAFVEERFSAKGVNASVEHGRQLFAQNCAKCHSSQNEDKADDFKRSTDDFSKTDFMREVELPDGEIVRADWMGSDKSVPAKVVGTYKCRALHRNHRRDRLWGMFANDDYSARPPTEIDARGQPIAGGLGYYRVPSLLSLWAFAPFMHNNAMGPEVCGRPQGMLDVHYTTYKGRQTDPATMHTCDLKFDPSLEGRLKVFDLSMDELLTPPAERPVKISVAAETVRIPIGLNLKGLGNGPVRRFYLEFPAGTPIADLGSLDYKQLIADILGSIPYLDRPADYNKYWNDRGGAQCGQKMAGAVKGTLALIEAAAKNPAAVQDQLHEGILDGSDERLKIYKECYSTCTAGQENLGHDRMTHASAEEKASLKAFLSTL